jgi:hypothetical protein
VWEHPWQFPYAVAKFSDCPRKAKSLSGAHPFRTPPTIGIVHGLIEGRVVSSHSVHGWLFRYAQPIWRLVQDGPLVAAIVRDPRRFSRKLGRLDVGQSANKSRPSPQ